MTLVMRGFGTRDEVALAVACWFDFFLSCGGWVCVFGVGPMFLGFYRVCRDGFLGIIDVFYYKLKKISETTMSIYSNQGCIFS